MDDRRRGGALCARHPQPSPQPRDRAGAAGGADPQSHGNPQTPRPYPPNEGKRPAAAGREEEAGGSEGAEGKGGVKGNFLFYRSKLQI